MLKAPKKQISNPEDFKPQVGDQKLETIEDLYRQGRVHMVVKAGMAEITLIIEKSIKFQLK